MPTHLRALPRFRPDLTQIGLLLMVQAQMPGIDLLLAWPMAVVDRVRQDSLGAQAVLSALMTAFIAALALYVIVALLGARILVLTVAALGGSAS